MNSNPNVTPAYVEACIRQENYFNAWSAAFDAQHHMPDPSLKLLTFCVLVTRNGHTVTGEAHCQNPAKFNAEIGRTEARKDAINKLWPMVVYAARLEAMPDANDPEYATDTQDAS